MIAPLYRVVPEQTEQVESFVLQLIAEQEREVYKRQMLALLPMTRLCRVDVLIPGRLQTKSRVKPLFLSLIHISAIFR